MNTTSESMFSTLRSGWVVTVLSVACLVVAIPRVSAEDTSLKDRQQSVAQRYQRLEELLLRLAEVEASENPERSALLRRAARQSREKFVLKKMQDASTALESEELQQAVDSQTAATNELAALLKLLLSEDRSKRIRDEKERFQKLAKDLKRTLRAQQSTRARTENDADLDEVKDEQESIADRSEGLADSLSENESSQNEPSESPDSKDNPEGNKSDDKDASDNQSNDNEDPNEKDPSKNDPNEKEPGKQESGDQKSNEQESGKQESGDPKSGDPKSQGKQSQSGDSQKQESQDSQKQNPNSQQQSGQPQSPSESQQSQSQSQQSKSQNQQSQNQSSKSQNNQAQNAPPTPEQQVEEQLRQAIKKMRQAEEELKKAEREKATEKQRQAEENLRAAIDRLERILRQLREEEMQRELAKLETRLRKMAAMQSNVLDDTVALAATPTGQRNRQTDLKAGDLAFEEKKITLEADRAMLLLREEGSSIAFPEVISQIRDDTLSVAERLGETKIDSVTQGIQRDILAALEEMIAATQQAQRDLEKRRQQKQGSPQKQGGQQEQPLVEQIAELKLIRTMETRIKSTTQRYASLIEAGEQDASELLPLLQSLSERQNRLYKVTRDLVLKRNQ